LKVETQSGDAVDGNMAGAEASPPLRDEVA
jgi:hypothetical protein